jgi:hypothetical protein
MIINLKGDPEDTEDLEVNMAKEGTLVPRVHKVLRGQGECKGQQGLQDLQD